MKRSDVPRERLHDAIHPVLRLRGIRLAVNFDHIPCEIREFGAGTGTHEVDVLKTFASRQCDLSIPNGAPESDAPGK
jgi:hypothetical protein